MSTTRVRLPRKLTKSVSGGTLAEAGRLHPVGSMNITLNMLPLNRVSMTLAENDLDLAMHDLVEVYNQNGSVGIYRVTKITKTLRKERKIELSHGLDVFSDATIAKIQDWNGSVAQFLQLIMDAQTQKIGGQFYWRLGRCDDTSYWEKDIKYDNAMECLTEIAKTEEDFMFTFDQSTFPWTLNFVRRNDTVMSEFRLRRNTESCSITLDDSDLCTRLYLSVSSENEEEGGGTYFTEGYYTFNDATAQAKYGIVCKTAGIDQSVFSPTVDLEAWKDAYFARHNAPNVQISIDGMELNRMTGESYDEMHLGRICRVALPDYGDAYNERIVSVQYPDALRKPNYVQVSLHNKRQTAEDAFSEISSTASTASSTARAAGRGIHNAETYWRKEFADTVYGLYGYIEMTASHLEVEFEDWYNRLYGYMEMTASHFQTMFEDQYRQLYGYMEMTASHFETKFVDQKNQLYGYVEATASHWESVLVDESASIRALVRQTASTWEAKIEGVTDENGNVTAASIGVAFNESGSSAYIDASHITIGSDQTAETVINSLVTKVGNLEATSVTTDNLSAKIADLATVSVNALTAAGNISASGAIMGTNLYFGSTGSYTNVGNAIANFGVAQENDGSITIPTTKLDGSQGTPINFNIAATQYFIDGVAANRASDVGSVQTTEETAIQLLSEYNTKYKIQTRYKRYNGTWANGSGYVVLTPPDRFQEGYDTGNAHRASDVGSVATTSDTAVQQLSEYNTKYKIQTRYQKADGTWANGSSYVVLTPVDRYQTGYDAGKPTGATLGSKTATTGIYYNVLVTKGDGGQQAFEVDLSAAYTAARSGYTLGTFTLASVTLQGDAYGDITPVGTKVTPTKYDVTLQGSSVSVDERYSTAYKTSTLGYYPRGNKYSGTLYTDGKTKYTGTLYVGGNYTEVTVVAGKPGAGVSLYKNKGTNTYRNSGNAATYYDVGESTALYKAGTKITGLRKAGTVDSTTYYTKS